MAEKKDAKGKDAENKKGKEEKAKGEKKEKSDTPDEAKGRSKLVLFGGIGVVLLAGLGVGGFFTYKTLGAKAPAAAATTGTPAPEHAKDEKKDAKKDESAKDEKKDAKKGESAKDEKKDAKDEKKDAKKDAPAKDEKGGDRKGGAGIGKIFALPKMDVNVGGADLGRGYARISVALEFEGEEAQQKELEARTPQIKDIIITTVSSRHRNDLLAKNGKEVLRKDLLNSINKVAERPVRNLYFTEFLVE